MTIYLFLVNFLIDLFPARFNITLRNVSRLILCNIVGLECYCIFLNTFFFILNRKIDRFMIDRGRREMCKKYCDDSVATVLSV